MLRYPQALQLAVRLTDPPKQPLVLHLAGGAHASALVVSGRRHAQDPADRLDTKALAVLIDERAHFGRSASSSVAKNADAALRIWLARARRRPFGLGSKVASPLSPERLHGAPALARSTKDTRPRSSRAWSSWTFAAGEVFLRRAPPPRSALPAPPDTPNETPPVPSSQIGADRQDFERNRCNRLNPVLAVCGERGLARQDPRRGGTVAAPARVGARTPPTVPRRGIRARGTSDRSELHRRTGLPETADSISAWTIPPFRPTRSAVWRAMPARA